MPLTSVSLLLISDQILKNILPNRISDYLLTQINKLNFQISKLLIIPENENEVKYQIGDLKKSSDILIIIGGQQYGIVYQALAILGSVPLINNNILEDYLKNERKTPYSKEEHTIPVQAKVIKLHGYPLVYMQQIYILNDYLYEDTFSNILNDHLKFYQTHMEHRKILDISVVDNSPNVSLFKNLTSNGCGKVELDKRKENLKVTIVNQNFLQVIGIEDKIRKVCPIGCDIKSTNDSDIWSNIYEDDSEHIRKCFSDIENCIDEFGLDNIFVSFNGGKDCTVLLHLFLATIKVKYSNYTKPISCLYVQSQSPFSEQNEFIKQCQSLYNLEIVTVQGSIKDALQETLQTKPNYKACLMGTRRTDPYCSDLKVFQLTDSNWPQIMRVSPLLDWHYSDIWDYLLYFKVPYCTLYDQGFTSLGNSLNTRRNPSLLFFNVVEDCESYLPAYKLMKENNERNGRESNGA